MRLSVKLFDLGLKEDKTRERKLLNLLHFLQQQYIEKQLRPLPLRLLKENPSEEEKNSVLKRALLAQGVLNHVNGLLVIL